MNLKRVTRKTLNYLRIDLTRNLEYDRLTADIMRRVIVHDSNCIDIGCHKGEILDTMLKLAPEGHHFAFEPIPEMFEQLTEKYNGRAKILPYALSDKQSTSKFNFVKNASAYSGLQNRTYKVKKPVIEKIPVEVTTLDSVIPTDVDIHFIKIDVEGAEFNVLKGGIELLKRNRPVIIFESGLGASEFYGTDPEMLYEFLNEEAGLNVSLLRNFYKGQSPLSRKSFIDCYNNNSEWYYIAHP